MENRARRRCSRASSTSASRSTGCARTSASCFDEARRNGAQLAGHRAGRSALRRGAGHGRRTLGHLQPHGPAGKAVGRRRRRRRSALSVEPVAAGVSPAGARSAPAISLQASCGGLAGETPAPTGSRSCAVIGSGQVALLAVGARHAVPLRWSQGAAGAGRARAAGLGGALRIRPRPRRLRGRGRQPHRSDLPAGVVR